MPVAADNKFYLKLSPRRRLRLVHEILQSLDDEIPADVLKEWQRRIKAHVADPASSLSWEEFCRKVGWKP